jgi:hypothetical protein
MDPRRRWVWPLLALVLFAVAAWLMLRGEPERPSERRADKVNLPRYAQREDFERQQARRTWKAPASPGTGEHAPDEPPMRKDPLLLALPLGHDSSAMVVEANALANSPAGELMVQCFNQRTRGRGLERLRERMGIDPLKDVDRMAFWDNGAMVTGSFAALPWNKLAEGQSVKQYGEHGTLYRPGQDGVVQLPDGGTELQGTTVGRWKDQVVFFTDSEEEAKEVLDRLEGRLRAGPGSLTEDLAYGDLYGTVDAKDLGELFPEDNPELKELFLKGARRVVVHMDASGDVGLVADVQGPGGEGLADVAKSLGGALALARVKATADGDGELAELLELAKVNRRDNGSFGLEVAIPLELIRKRMSYCEPPPGQRPLAEQEPVPVETGEAR